jgi:hypothetical protein
LPFFVVVFINLCVVARHAEFFIGVARAVLLINIKSGAIN